MLEADARKALACNNRKASDRMAASEGETTMGRLGGRTGRRISNKSLYWFDADADWADDWYNNRMQHAMDAALEAKTLIKIVFSRAVTRALVALNSARSVWDLLGRHNVEAAPGEAAAPGSASCPAGAALVLEDQRPAAAGSAGAIALVSTRLCSACEHRAPGSASACASAVPVCSRCY